MKTTIFPDIKIELDRSDYVKQRLCLMKSLQIPTLSEAKSNLGSCLAQILFDQCDAALKEDFGLTPLKGTGDELWLSPSDLLIGKLALTPPFTGKHIQALTHQGILKIGEEIEKKFWNETKMREENYFELRKRHIVDQFEEIFRIETKNIETRERLSYQNQIQKMLEEFNEILLEELNNLEKKLKREREASLRNQRISINTEWELKFKEATNTTVQKMTVKFLDELDRQKSVMINNFKLDLQKAYLQKGYDINMEKTKCKESIKQLRHNLECKNIANMMYVLCMERRKCCTEKEKVEQYYVKEIKKLNKLISDKDHRIKTLTEETNKQIMEVNLRETCLLEIIRQFQKFINFALRAAPTQAEFLLSIEKMMAFELTKTVLKSNYSRLRPCSEILPWKDQEKPINTPNVVGLEIEDYHNCLKELTLLHSEEGLGEEDYLPAFNYKNKLYVREDFRNMISQGIEITKSNELWSKDVEILIQTLRKSVSNLKEESERSMSKKSSVKSEQTAPPRSIEASSVQFMIRESTPKTTTWSHDSSRKLSEERRASLKPVFNSLHNINFAQIGTVEKKPALIAATNSLELILKRGSVRYLKPKDEVELEELEVDEHDEKLHTLVRETQGSFSILKRKASVDDAPSIREMGESCQSSKKTSPKQSVKDGLVMDAKDSVIMKKASLLKKSAEFNITPNDSIELRIESKSNMRRKASKLVTAKNSLELLRESRTKIVDTPILYSPKDSSKQKSSVSCAKTKCNDKCSQSKDAYLDDLMVEDFRYIRKDSAERSIKMSHIEVIKLENSSREASVSINAIPMIYDTGSADYSTDLTDMYKEKPKPKKTKTKKVAPSKGKSQKLPKALKVVGDMNAKEHLQTTNEFTEERIHSLIELIKDNPALMRTFTACTR
ncbi:uncharacterized protein LOC108912488 [Anoplophora glabripennis]|uniref:uncharacterized protein LOC108912488 n=1 Tax=Anoplophora glabripennis TaxID=217634 RepID=UPI000874658A|nr:uncharacterized protein LOC108912488 [Anoplophora glabripennis]